MPRGPPSPSPSSNGRKPNGGTSDKDDDGGLNYGATCKQCLKASVCAILRNQVALAKQFPRLDKDSPEGAAPPMFDPYATALTCVEWFPPDARLFRGESEEDLR